MVIRSHNKTRSSWALVGLAVRIAQGLGLHKDGEGRAFSAFEAEMRRRLWWQILVLDMRASEDRGSEPVVQPESFNTRMPRNLNDEDFGHDSQHPLPEKKGVTQMTFCLIGMDISNTCRRVNFTLPTCERQTLTLQQKEELVKACTDRIESHYLAGCDPSDQSTWLVYMMVHSLILELWLLIQYPLQSRKSAPQDYPRGQSLRTVVAYLTIGELIEENESAAGFTWFFNTYVPWHALAVALAELCTETQGPLADRAWAVIDKGYRKWSERVADTKQGMLWRPVKRLMKRARAARLRDQGFTAETPDAGPIQAGIEPVSSPPSGMDPISLLGLDPMPPSSLDPILRNCDVTFGLPSLNLDGNRPNFNLSMALDDLGPIFGRTTDPPPETNLLGSMSMDMGLGSGMMGTESSSGEPVNWDNWNEFIFDVGAPSLYGEWPMPT